MRDEYVFTSGGFEAKSLDEIKKVAPAAFSKGVDPVVSDRYSRVDTIDLVKGLDKHGWQPVSARQVGEGKWGRHIIRLTNKKSGIIKVGGITAQMIIDNSYDGTSLGNFSAGAFRKACANGLTVGIPGLATTYSFKHIGIDDNKLKEILEQAIQDFGTIQEHIEMMQDTPLSDKQKVAFVMKAVAQRDPQLYVNEKGKLDGVLLKRMNNLEELLKPIRDNDKGPELWKVFNVIQEKLIRGGYRRISEKGRKVSVPGIGNPIRNVAFNRQLWNLAETYLPKS